VKGKGRCHMHVIAERYPFRWEYNPLKSICLILSSRQGDPSAVYGKTGWETVWIANPVQTTFEAVMIPVSPERRPSPDHASFSTSLWTLCGFSCGIQAGPVAAAIILLTTEARGRPGKAAAPEGVLLHDLPSLLLVFAVLPVIAMWRWW